jgi:hypothetical protein
VTIPPSNEFSERARREYRFLVDEFGYSEVPESSNPFEVGYVNPTLLVSIEGINWGFGIHILFTPVRSGSDQLGETVPLWAIAQVRCPVELEKSRHVAGQLALLSCYSRLLRECATDVLQGDLSIFPAARAILEQEAARSREPKKPRPS